MPQPLPSPETPPDPGDATPVAAPVAAGALAGALGRPERLAALQRTALLDSGAEVRFDRLTRLASRLLRAPVALVSLVDGQRQFFKSQVGLGEPWATARQTPLSHSFCQHVVATGAPLIVSDARRDPRVCDNLAIGDLGVIAYAGAPLTTAAGEVLGSFCVIDTRPRIWTDDEIALVRDLAAAATTEIELRLAAGAAAQAAAALRDREVRLRLAMEAAGLGDWQLDVASETLETSGPTKAHFGRPPEAPFSYADLLAAIHPHDRTRVRRAIRRALAAGADFDAEFRARWPDGSERWIAARGRSFGAGGRPGQKNGAPTARLVGVMQDVTARKEAETDRETLLAAERAARGQAEAGAARAAAAVRLRDQVLAAVSHDLKTPLTAISGHAQLLARQAVLTSGGGTPDPQRLTTSTAAIQSAAATMARWIDELTAVARDDAENAAALDRRPVDLVALARRVVAEHQASAPYHRLRLVAATAEVEGIWDATGLERVLHNLIGNAVKYTPGGGEVVLEVAAEPDAAGVAWAVLRVRDAGIGIPAADLARIFEPFRRGANVAGRVPGTGIGLASARQVVERHGGTIHVASVEGQGSTFTVRLPISPPASDVPASDVQ